MTVRTCLLTWLAWGALWAPVVAQQAPPAGERNVFFDSEGVRLRYLVRGTGPPVLLIHGFAINIELQWGGVLGPLAEDYRVIAFDCRGHGLSDKPHDPAAYGLEMVHDAARLLDHLEVERAHVVGYSMGALIAGRFAAMYPERTRSLVLGGGGMELDAELTALCPALAEALETRGSIEPLMRALHPADRLPPTPAQLAVTNLFLMSINDRQALAAVVRSFPETQRQAPASDALFRPLREMPVLAMVGSDDPLRRTLPQIRQRVPEAEVAILPAGDHVNTPGHPRFVRRLVEFLDRASASDAKAEPTTEPGREEPVR